MTNSFFDNARIFWVLLCKEHISIKSKLKKTFFNLMMIAGVQLILQVYFYKFMGMPEEYAAPIFLGTIGFIVILQGYEKSVSLLRSIHTTNFMSYHMGLPLSKNWLFGSYVVAGAIDLTLQSVIPPMAFFMFFLNPTSLKLSFLMLLVPFSALAMITLSLFFVVFGLFFTPKWFYTNVWPRILIPLLMLSSTFFPLKRLCAQTPFFSKITLLNPITYALEGYRIILLGANISIISLAYCSLALLFFALSGSFLLTWGMRKNLDPV